MADPDRYLSNVRSAGTVAGSAPPVAGNSAYVQPPQQAQPVPNVQPYQAPNVGPAPAPYQIQGQAPAPWQMPQMPDFNIPNPPAPMGLQDIQQAIAGMPGGQIATPNLPSYQGTVPAPQYVAPPQYGNFQSLLTQYGLLPDVNNAQAMQSYMQAPSIGGASFSGVNTSLPDYNPTQSLDERVQAYLTMQYGGTEASINKALQDMAQEYALQKGTQEQYGQLGDAKLAELYQQLRGNVAGGATDIAGLFGTAQQGINQAYGDASAAVQSSGQQVGNNVQQLAERLGLQQALPEGLANIGDYQTQALGDIAKNQASSQGLLDAYNAILQSANARDVSNVDTLGTNKRADLQSLIGGNLASLMHQYNTGRGDVQQQLTNLNIERGGAAVDRYATLEDQLYERKYRKSLDEANLGVENARLGLQASEINQRGQIASQEIQLKKQDAMYNALRDTQQFAFQNANLQYMSQKDYQDSLENYFNNSFNSEMQKAGINIDVNKFNANQTMQQAGLGLQAAGFLGDQNQQNFANRMGISQFNAGNFFDYAGLGLQANQNAFNQFIGGNQLGLAAQGQGFGQWATQSELGQQNQINAANVANMSFNQQLALSNYGLDLTKFTASQDPNSIDNQVKLANIRQMVQSGEIDKAQLALQQFQATATAATLPLEIEQLKAQIASAQSTTSARNAMLPYEIEQSKSATAANNALTETRLNQALASPKMPAVGSGIGNVPAALQAYGITDPKILTQVQTAVATARDKALVARTQAINTPKWASPQAQALGASPLPVPPLASFITDILVQENPNIDPVALQIAAQIAGTR